MVMKDLTLPELEKVKQNYLGQMQETRNRLIMLEGALQAVEALIKLSKGEIKLDQENPS
jgi:hypothetical protein